MGGGHGTVADTVVNGVLRHLAVVCIGWVVVAASQSHAAQSAPGLPDLPPDTLAYDGERLRIIPLVALVGDYTFFEQDAPSLLQVGAQEDTQDLRAARIGAAVQNKGPYRWSAFFAADYQERRTRDDAAFQLYDLRLRLPVAGFHIDIGKQKQPFVFEMAGLSILNPQQERILSPFFVTRSIGVKLSGQLAGDRMTWAAGWFNDWLESGATFSDNANDFVARFTGLLSVSPDDHDYLHLGIGLRRVGPDAGLVRMSGRPGSNVTDFYVDTGEFEADFVSELGLELIWTRTPFTLAVEHVMSRAQAADSGDPDFHGSYVMLSWMLTGESRPYLRALGSAGAITPNARYGAVELVTRYSHLDLTDGAIDGGRMDKWHLGLNWWINAQWKAGVSWGDADLDRGGVTGNTRMLLCRLQWYLP